MSGYEKPNYHKYNGILAFALRKQNEQERIELHYLPYSICGTDVLGFHHSTKSTKASSSRSDTKVVACMRRGGAQHGTGWAAPSCCSLLLLKSVFLS